RPPRSRCTTPFRPWCTQCRASRSRMSSSPDGSSLQGAGTWRPIRPRHSQGLTTGSGAWSRPVPEPTRGRPARNASEAELAHFGALAGRWWDPEGELRTLHDMNPARVELIGRWTGLAGQRVLDVGCGGGLLSEAMAAKGAEVTGIDLSREALNVARLHLIESGLTGVQYLEKDAAEFAEANPAVFDVVTCLELIEHVPDPAALVEACARLVKAGGHVIV